MARLPLFGSETREPSTDIGGQRRGPSRPEVDVQPLPHLPCPNFVLGEPLWGIGAATGLRQLHFQDSLAAIAA